MSAIPDYIADGLVTTVSRHSVTDTINHLAEIVTASGLVVFARIDHAAHAAEVGVALRPTELLIFGEPSSWAALMQEVQSVGLNLPMKALAWEDENGEVWLTYYDIAWIAQRHRLGPEAQPGVRAIAGTMAKIAVAATMT
jgi:uncharacterized protein (DUF302 family)